MFLFWFLYLAGIGFSAGAVIHLKTYNFFSRLAKYIAIILWPLSIIGWGLLEAITHDYKQK